MKFQLICCLVSHNAPATLLSKANNLKKELHWCGGSWIWERAASSEWGEGTLQPQSPIAPQPIAPCPGPPGPFPKSFCSSWSTLDTGRALRSAWILLQVRISITSSSRLFPSQSVLPRGAASALGRAHKGDDHTGTAPRKSPPALSHFQLCSDQSWLHPLPSCSHTPPVTSALSAGAADRTGIVSVHWDLKGFKRAEETTTPLLLGCLDSMGRRRPRKGKVGNFLPFKRSAAVFESNNKVQDQALDPWPGVGFQYKSHSNSFPLPFSFLPLLL